MAKQEIRLPARGSADEQRYRTGFADLALREGFMVDQRTCPRPSVLRQALAIGLLKIPRRPPESAPTVRR
jgi:hypothetical protein